MGDESQPESRWSFHKEEYIALRAAIDRHESQRSRLQYATVFGSILITWGIIRVDTRSYAEPMLALLSLAPLVLLLSGWLIARTHDIRLREIETYLRELERRFAWQGRGWQASLEPAAAAGRRRGRAIWPTAILFLGIGLIEAGVLAMNLRHPHPTVRVPEWRYDSDAAAPDALDVVR
ncbi:hypothetical protein [Amaricoccus sp.]|uniref:hypothetical protein n=1 Tax=Amaricoccus sp. TaxID=1872485 RepID=UPI001B458513|nr:hypothetical protein [Amaricoccus sp.]MBP7001184.1 hypothetical protein [Amaricoccus sp.]